MTISSMILRIVEGSDNEHRALLSMTHEVKHVTNEFIRGAVYNSRLITLFLLKLEYIYPFKLQTLCLAIAMVDECHVIYHVYGYSILEYRPV
jgi:hypothetical protein